jgi:dolichol-phosphate mannosyltransferase
MTPSISLIIPTLNEAANLPALVQRIAAALDGRDYEILIVDDNSRDNTPDVCAELAQKYPLRLLTRANPKDGLSGAVLHGMAEARGDTFVVMDADLQHPPEKIPDLIASLDAGADFVIGSRYVSGGTTQEQWGLLRRINSNVATFLARPFAGRVHDPMSGFFALRRSTYERAQRLTPLGYKIGLELMCKCRVQEVREVPIHFATREKGESKLTIKQQFKYLEHLSRLYDFCYPRLSPMFKFIIATALAWFVGFATSLGLISSGIEPALGFGLAYLSAIAVLAVFHIRYIRTQREFIIRPHPARDFVISSIFELSMCILAALYFSYRMEKPSGVEIFILSFGAATGVRYVLRKELHQDVRGLRREIRVDDTR